MKNEKIAIKMILVELFLISFFFLELEKYSINFNSFNKIFDLTPFD